MFRAHLQLSAVTWTHVYPHLGKENLENVVRSKGPTSIRQLSLKIQRHGRTTLQKLESSLSDGTELALNAPWKQVSHCNLSHCLGMFCGAN